MGFKVSRPSDTYRNALAAENDSAKIKSRKRYKALICAYRRFAGSIDMHLFKRFDFLELNAPTGDLRSSRTERVLSGTAEPHHLRSTLGKRAIGLCSRSL